MHDSAAWKIFNFLLLPIKASSAPAGKNNGNTYHGLPDLPAEPPPPVLPRQMSEKNSPHDFAANEAWRREEDKKRCSEHHSNNQLKNQGKPENLPGQNNQVAARVFSPKKPQLPVADIGQKMYGADPAAEDSAEKKRPQQREKHADFYPHAAQCFRTGRDFGDSCYQSVTKGLFLVLQFGVQFLGTFRTYTVAELRTGMFGKICLKLLPVSLVVTNFFA